VTVESFFFFFFFFFLKFLFCSVRGGFFSPVKRRIQTTSVTTGIVVSPDKKAAMAAAAAAAENVLENDAKAKQAATVVAVATTPVVAAVANTNNAARQSPLRVSATASPRAVDKDDSRKRNATPTTTPKKRLARTTTPQAAARVASPVPVATAPVVNAAAVVDSDSMAADLAQTCRDAEVELAVSKQLAAKDADIDRLERELFHALFLAIKLSLTEQGAKFNCKHDATDLLASARRQNVAFNSSTLTNWIDRQLRVMKK
jgi:hypothetical protein